VATTNATPYEPFTVAVVPNRHEVAVIPKGELDLSCVDALDREVRELRAAGFDQIVLDLRQVRFLDSTGLRLLLSLRSDAERDGHDLTLVRGPRAVQRIFELTATHGLFDWRED
jgi:anti-sigma B factor antagonist